MSKLENLAYRVIPRVERVTVSCCVCYGEAEILCYSCERHYCLKHFSDDYERHGIDFGEPPDIELHYPRL